MVAEQIARRGIADRKVLDAMGCVPRECFVRQDSLYRAYADVALAIDCQQTISQPLMVAMMTEALALTGCERILEIGTGSGYQTAVLAQLLSKGGEVFSVERHAELSACAEQRLAQLGYRGTRLLVGDGSLGWPAEAPYDGILVTAAAPRCPPALWEQLKAGGRLVIPLGDRKGQILQTLSKQPDGTSQTSNLVPCRFVPLLGEGV